MFCNSFVGAREREQQKYNFKTLFDPLIYSHEVGFQKPDPRIYALTCDCLEIAPENIVFVNDSAENILAAQAFGMNGIFFQDNVQTITVLQKYLQR